MPLLYHQIPFRVNIYIKRSHLNMPICGGGDYCCADIVVNYKTWTLTRQCEQNPEMLIDMDHTRASFCSEWRQSMRRCLRMYNRAQTTLSKPNFSQESNIQCGDILSCHTDDSDIHTDTRTIPVSTFEMQGLHMIPNYSSYLVRLETDTELLTILCHFQY